MNKEKIYFTIGFVAFQCGAFMIHYGLGLMLLGVWLLVCSFIEYDKHQDEEEDDESVKKDDTELPPFDAPHGTVWPYNGEQYLRVHDTWIMIDKDIHIKTNDKTETNNNLEQ